MFRKGRPNLIFAILLLIIAISGPTLPQEHFIHAQSLVKTLELGVIKPSTLSEYESGVLINIISMVEHAGIPYRLINPDFTHEELLEYKVLIFAGLASLKISSAQEVAITKAIDSGVSVIWIGNSISRLPTLQTALGIKYVNDSSARDLQISKVRFNVTEIPVYWDETLTLVNAEEAIPIAHFIDERGTVSYIAATYFMRNATSGHAFFFGFSIHDYWNSSPESAWNWMRLLQLYEAMLKSSEGMMALSPYPNNLRTVLLVRIEDVNPYNNEQKEWVSRARAFKNYTEVIGLPLNVAVIPVYANPSKGILRTLSESPQLLTFLLEVINSKGTIIQHGFTHQYGNLTDDYTGIDYEFYDEKSGLWLQYEDQLDRIRKGKIAIEENLPVKVTVFEAPHYKSNLDTIKAASKLGLKFFNEASDRSFIDRFGGKGYLVGYKAVSIPETLNFIPNSPTTEFYSNFLESTKLLYQSNGVLLFFVHLFTDEQLMVAKNLIGEIKKLERLWTPNVEEAGKFWSERIMAYETMEVRRDDSGDKLTITLGRVSVKGLTLRYFGEKEIGFVKVNGKVWSEFGKDYIILETLTSEHNTILIELVTQHPPDYSHFYVSVTVVIGLVGASLYVIKKRGWKA